MTNEGPGGVAWRGSECVEDRIMSIIKSRFVPLLVGTLALGAYAGPAYAGTGCNGVVNWLVWGCAGWDNNNGPKFPYYSKKAVPVAIPKGGIAIAVKDGQALATVNGVQMPVIGGAAAIVAQGGGNIVAQGGGNLVAQGAGNLQVWSQ